MFNREQRCQGLFPPFLSSAEKSPGNEVAQGGAGGKQTCLTGNKWRKSGNMGKHGNFGRDQGLLLIIDQRIQQSIRLKSF